MNDFYYNNNIINCPDFNLGSAGNLYGLTGQTNKAMAIIDELNRRAEEGRYYYSTSYAMVYTGLDEYEKAIDYLKIGYKNKDFSMVWLNVFPYYDPLRSYSRFREIMKKMNFH